MIVKYALKVVILVSPLESKKRLKVKKVLLLKVLEFFLVKFRIGKVTFSLFFLINSQPQSMGANVHNRKNHLFSP